MLFPVNETALNDPTALFEITGAAKEPCVTKLYPFPDLSFHCVTLEPENVIAL